MGKLVKDYKVNSGIYITKELLEVLWGSYSCTYPDHIERKIKKLLSALIIELEKEHIDLECDATFELFERVIYEKEV